MIILDTHAWIWWVNESATLTSAAAQAIAAADLLGVHIIAASCLIHGVQLVSKDRRIRDWGGIEVIW